MSKSKTMISLLMLGIISLVLGPAATQGYASTGDTLFIVPVVGTEDTKEMALKATKENGQTVKNPDFRITADNVVQIQKGGMVRVFDSSDDYELTKARTIDKSDHKDEIGIADDGIINFADYAVGVYTLEIIVDDDKLYAAIVVIGQQSQTEVQKVIKKETERVIVDIDIDIDCGKGYFERNGECIKKRDKPSICYFNPVHKDCEPVDGQCPPGFGFNDNDKCIPQGRCPEGYGRGEDDETGTCYKKDKLQKCEDGSVRIPSDTCPPVKPVVDKCKNGYTLINGICQLADTNPVCPPECAGLAPPDCEGTYNPSTGICEDLSIPKEPPTQSELITPPEVMETVDDPYPEPEEDTEEPEEEEVEEEDESEEPEEEEVDEEKDSDGETTETGE